MHQTLKTIFAMSNVDTVDAIIFLQVHGEASLSQFTLECLGAGKQKAASHKMRLAVLTSTFLPEILWARKRDWAERARIPLSFKTSPQGTHTSFFPTFAEQYFIRIYLCISPESRHVIRFSFLVVHQNLLTSYSYLTCFWSWTRGRQPSSVLE